MNQLSVGRIPIHKGVFLSCESSWMARGTQSQTGPRVPHRPRALLWLGRAPGGAFGPADRQFSHGHFCSGSEINPGGRHPKGSHQKDQTSAADGSNGPGLPAGQLPKHPRCARGVALDPWPHVHLPGSGRGATSAFTEQYGLGH